MGAVGGIPAGDNEGETADPAAPATRYSQTMSQLVPQMIADYQANFTQLNDDVAPVGMDASVASQTRIWLNRLKRKWDGIFNKKAAEIADKFFSQTDLAAQRNLDDSLKMLSGGLTIKTPDMPGEMKERLTAATAENVALTKTIPERFHRRIEGAAFSQSPRRGSQNPS